LSCLLENNFEEFFLLELVQKIKQMYVLLVLADYYSIITSFDLWMSKGAYDIFALVINSFKFVW
jgi:hypothetical protein